ncbi:MAG: NAD(P)H-dependent oxidoreductase [Bacteroidales bacterium]|jgi:NAD(P)H-dependent FMN reductase|nr:NAD(P)H-dependent oxidoreductase [Bacteroidales bacterium]MDD4703824.1 NAD(P)H-dependent oxidoreductase [Bacteroidales bacterium]
MKQIAIISPSVREERVGHRVALFIKKYFEENSIAKVDLIDLKEFDFPLFNERLMFQKNPSEKLLDFSERVKKADGIVIVSSVYNYSFPASLKNAIDVLYPEWNKKVVALASATMGVVEGLPTTFQLENILAQMKAIVSPMKFFAINIANEFTEDGSAVNKEMTEKQVKPMVDELMFLVDKFTN